MRSRRKRMRGWIKWAFVTSHLLIVAICVLRFTIEWADGTVSPVDWLVLAAAPAILAYTFYTVSVGLRV